MPNENPITCAVPTGGDSQPDKQPLHTYTLRNAREEDGCVVFAENGANMFYKLEGETVKSHSFLVFDVENREDYSVRLNTGFWEDAISGESTLTVFTGILPGVSTSVCIPLNVLSGGALFGSRYPGILKTVIKGVKVNLDRLHSVSIGLPPIHKETRLCIRNVRLTREAVSTPLKLDEWLDEFGQYRHAEWPGKTHSLAELRENMSSTLNEAQVFLSSQKPSYFGDPSQTYEATGFFRLEQNGGKHWLITPDGGRFFSTGADCIVSDIISGCDGEHTQKDFLKENLQKAFGDAWYEHWRTITHYRMLKWNMNTLACWGDYRFAKYAKIPYTKHLRDFPKTKETVYRDFPDVFSPEYEANTAVYAQQMYEDLNDPYLIGYFMANEPHWAFAEKLQLGYELVRNKQNLHTKKHLITFMRKKYGDRIEALNTHWGTTLTGFADLAYLGEFPVINQNGLAALEAFATLMVSEYVRIPAQALKAIDPHHLNLGLRYAIITSDVMFGGSEFFDVYSINCYEHLCDNDVTTAHTKTGKPIIVGEYQFGALDRGLSANGIRGAANQIERGKAIRRYVEHAAALDGCVGVHYFQFNDQGFLGRGDGENYNIGFVDICNRAHTEAAEAYAAANRNVYAVADGVIPVFDEPVGYVPSIFY